MNINDPLQDLSLAANALFTPALATNLQYLGLFGGALSRLTKNLSGLTNPTVVGSPTLGTGYATLSKTAYIQLAQQDAGGSETFYIACDPGATTGASGGASASLLSAWNGTYGFTQSLTIDSGGQGYGINALINFLNTTPAATDISAPFPYVLGANNVLVSGPRALMLRIDMTNMVIVTKDMTAGTTKTTAIPAGYTRPAPTNPVIRLGGYTGDGTSATGSYNCYATALYNVANTDAQDLLVYAQLKAYCAIKGITV